MSRTLSTIIAFSLLWNTGCAAIFFDDRENVTFQSTPGEAEIRLNGTPVGRTPQMLNIEAKDYGVEFRKAGCEPYMTSLEADTSGGAVATSVIFGLLIGGIFELLSLVEGPGIYRDLPDSVFGNLRCGSAETASSD